MAASSEALKRAKKKWESEKVEQLTVQLRTMNLLIACSTVLLTKN